MWQPRATAPPPRLDPDTRRQAGGGGLLVQPPPEEPPLLVVDDDPLSCAVLARCLEARGHRVETASSGDEALAAVFEAPPALVLLDIMMPRTSGLEVLTRLRERFSQSELPVIMQTALDDSRDIVEALRRGANDYVTKPIDRDVVAARVDTQLALRRAAEEAQRLNRHLAEAHDRIARLLASGAEASRDLESWCRSTAADLAASLDAAEVLVWVLRDGRLVSISETELEPPRLEDVRAASEEPGAPFDGPGGDAFVVVAAAGGDFLGVLRIRGKRSRWDDVDRRLIAGFAHQLGGALELRELRTRIAAADRARAEGRPGGGPRGPDAVFVCPDCWRCYPATERRCAEDGTHLLEPRPIPYRIVDRYDLVKVIGEGGMGTVFEARDRRLDRLVAVKVVKPEHLGQASMRDRFAEEVRTIAAIGHPGVVAVFDSGDLGDGSLFLVMERVYGSPLHEVLGACGPGTPAQVASLLTQGASALAAVHRAGVIHRDIKPANVLMSGEEGGFRAKLFDFGLARRAAAGVHVTQAGLIMGTPAYMSPEQIGGRQMDARSDVYSFAAVVYEALVGHAVILETELEKVFVEVAYFRPPLVSETLSGIPREVDEAFCSALAKSPADRPADVEAWAGPLASALSRVRASVRGWRLPLGAPDAPSRREQRQRTVNLR